MQIYSGVFMWVFYFVHIKFTIIQYKKYIVHSQSRHPERPDGPKSFLRSSTTSRRLSQEDGNGYRNQFETQIIIRIAETTIRNHI